MCGELNQRHVKQRVTLCGWLQYHRFDGYFIILRDAFGLVQVVLPNQEVRFLSDISSLSGGHCCPLTFLSLSAFCSLSIPLLSSNFLSLSSHFPLCPLAVLSLPCPLTVLSSHCPLYVLSLSSLCPLTVLSLSSLSSHSPLSALSLTSYCPLAVLFLSSLLPLTVLFPSSHCPVSVLSLSCLCPLAVLSQN